MSMLNLSNEKTPILTCVFISMLVAREKEWGSYIRMKVIIKKEMRWLIKFGNEEIVLEIVFGNV
jgi:hypothetical protein